MSHMLSEHSEQNNFHARSGRNDPRSIAMIIVSMLIFGTIGIFRRNIPLSSGLLAFSRGIMGGLFLLGLMTAKKKVVERKFDLRTLISLLLGGIFIGVNWILLFEAYNYTTVSLATLCYYMQPAIVILLSPLLFKETLTRKKIICVVVSVVGMVLVSKIFDTDNLRTGNTKGILLGLGAALFYSCVIIMNKKIQMTDSYQRTMIQLLAAGIVILPYLIITKGFYVGDFNTYSVILLLIVGIVHTGIAYSLYFGSIDGLNIQSVAILSYVDPVSALFFSALFLGEKMSVLSIIGAIMIIGSSIFSEIKKDDIYDSDKQ